MDSIFLIILMKVNKMYIKLEMLWNEITKFSTYGGYRVKNEAYSVFLDEFLKMYGEFKDHFMKDEVQYLDRYKVASIIMFCLINTKVLEPISKECENWIIKCNELALCAGLAYMQNEYNQECLQTGNRPLKRYIFPNVKTGTTSYPDTIVRMLYHIDTGSASNIFSIAMLLLTLEKYNVTLTA